MDNSEGELAQVKEEADADAMFHEIMENDIKTVIVKEEPSETTLFIKCETCYDTSTNEAECVHIKNDRLGDLEQDNKLQERSLHLADGVHTNTFQKEVKPKVENNESISSQREENSIIQLIDTEVTVKEEEYLDSPDYLSTDVDLAECEIGEVKTEDGDIFCEDVKIQSVNEGLTDSKASWSSDEDTNRDVHPGSSKESQKANTKSKRMCLVPGCKSSTFLTPNKLFLPLPRDKNERESWQRAMRKTDFVGPKTNHYCCGDHFKIEEDAENYMQFQMMGNVKLKLKPGIVPSRFACQNVREYSSKRFLPDVVKEAHTSAKKSRKSQAKEVRDQATQTEYHLNMRDVGVQVNLCDDEELKKTQRKTKKAPKKRTRRFK